MDGKGDSHFGSDCHLLHLFNFQLDYALDPGTGGEVRQDHRENSRRIRECDQTIGAITHIFQADFNCVAVCGSCHQFGRAIFDTCQIEQGIQRYASHFWYQQRP
jgi:hypothetical protein